MRGITKRHKTLKAALILFVCATTGAAQAACEQGAVDLRWDGGSVRFTVEIADTFEDRARGLMYRESLPRYGGMLFVYDQPLSVSFWMKNTLIPLDMIFLDRHGVVQNIHENAVPGSLDSIPGGDNILAVLEVNGGMSRKLGVPVGAEMRHPAFADSDPIWPCN
ncbi:DUF192 domain-containing protein [Neptunicoccus sediminis]|uniref:DUF192 domain-containing protein n=1 Tax=Neptunicoccus sediminis TaxID=1892596 RepID=UPI00316AE0FB